MGFIDEQVVKMRFDNDGFEKGVSDTISSLEKLNHSVESLGSGSASSALQGIQHSLEQINFTSLNNAIDEVNSRFSTMGIAAARVIQNITDKVETMAESLANALTVKSLKIGFSEYEQVMDISKVIMYNTTASAEEIKGAVRDLQSYADRTIFNYNDLTGVFSNWVTMAGSLEQSGVKLEEAVEGLANMIALSGKGTGEFSRIGQATSKVFSQGYMTRMTMMQFMRNGALTKAFKDAIEPAVKKVGDYEKYLRAMAASNGDLMTATSPQTAKKDSDWFTAEVFAEVMKTYSDKSTDLGARASGAAETVATPSQLVSVTYEAIATGISRAFESIFGDMKEAPEFLSHLSFLLNGDDKIPGILSGFFLDVGSFFEDWHDLGGRESVIQGLFDSFEALQNVVESVKIVFSNFFPGITPEKLAEISEGFANNAAKFKDWTENLRASFGDFTRWDFWFEEKLEQVPKETTIDMDEDVVIDTFLNRVQSTYGGLITEFIDQFNNSKYVKSIKDNSEAGYHYTKDISAINAAIKKYNGGDSFERFMQYWTGVITEEELNDIFYEDGVKNAEHFDQVSRDTAEVAALIEILNENGIDGNELLQQIRDELAIKNTEYETKRTRTPHHKARVIEWQEANWQQSDFVDALEGVFSILAVIRDTASSLYNEVIKPMISSITSGIFMSALEVLSSIGAHLVEFYRRIKDSDIINKFFKGIYNFITENTNLASFFSSITVTLIQLDNIIWDVINGFTDFMEVIAQNSVFQTVIHYLSTIWNIISPFISNNLKTGGVVGGFLGALKGALTGFFTGGPLGMIFGALKGGASGFLKGGLFGVLIDVIKYLEANGPKVKYILSQVFGIVSNLVGSFTSGLFSESGIFGGISNFFSTLKKTVSDIKSGAVDPLDAIVGFLKSDAVKNGLTTIQEKLNTFGAWLADKLKWIKDHVAGVYDYIKEKWNGFEASSPDNPIVKLFEFIDNSAFFSFLKFFKASAGAIFQVLGALIDGFADGGLSKAIDNLDEAKDVGWLRAWDLTFQTIHQSAEEFKKGDAFTAIKEGFYNLGSGIRSFVSLVGNGTIGGIILDVFSMIGKLGSSLVNGLFSETQTKQVAENMEETEKTYSSGLMGIKERLEEFINGEGFATLQEKIYNIGSIINEGIENFKVKFIEHFPGITDALGRLVDILTDSAFYSAISTFKDIVIDFVVALVEGFTGSEIKRAGDDLATTISTINAALTGFKADDKYKTILDFIKDVGKTIRKIPTYIGHIAKYVSGLFGKDSVGNIIFSGLASILLPKNKDTENAEITEEMANEAQEAATEAVKEATDTVQEAAAEAVEEAAKSAEKTTDAVESGGILSSVGNFILDLFGTTVHAGELEGAEEGLQTANDAINTMGQTADNVNNNTDTVKKANVGISMFENFSKGLSTFLNVLSGTLTGLLAGGGIAILIGLLTVVQGFGTVFSILGNYNLVLVAKVIKTVALVLGVALLGIIGLANAMASEGGEERVSQAVTYVESLITIIGLMAAVITAIQVFGTKPSLGQTVAANPFTALQEFAKGMAKAFEALVNNVGIFAVVAGVIGGIIMIINALTKLAGFSSLKIEKITDLVTNLSLILGGVAVLLVLMSKMGGKGSGNGTIHIQADMDPVMYAAPILMVAASIKLIIDAVSELVGLMNNKDINPDSLKTAGWIVAVIAAGMAVVIAAIAGLSKETSSIGVGNGGVTVQGKSGNVFSAAAAIVAITFAIGGVVDAIGKLHDKLINKEGVITEDKLSFIVASVGMIALLMVAIGQAIKMMGGTTTGPTDIKFGASVAMIAMVVAVQGLIGAITDLAKTFKKDLGNGVSVLNILSAIGTVLGMMWGVSDSIGTMKDSKINLGTSVAMIAMVLAIKGLIAEITNLAKFYMANVNTLGEFASVIGSIGTVLISLSTLGTEASGMKLQKGEKSGLGNAITMLAMVGAVLGILSMVQEVAKVIEEGNLASLIEGLAAVEGILWSLAAIANFLKVTEVSKDTKTSTNILSILGIVAAVTAALTFLNADGVIDDADKSLKIAQSMAAIIAALAAVTFVIQKVSLMGGDVSEGIVAMWKVAGGIAILIVAIGNIGTMVDNFQKKNGQNGLIGDAIGSLFTNVGEGLLVAAGFLGDLAAEFKKHSMVTDSETIKNSMEALGGGAEELNAAVEAVTPENFLKIQEVLEAFDGLTTAMMNFAVSNGGVSIPANMFENLGNDLKAFAPLFEEFCESIAALDNTIEKDYGIESFGSTTLNDYVELVKRLLSVDAGDTFTSGVFGSTKFSGMKNSFDDIAKGVGAFIDGCETIQTKLDGGEDGKGKKADIEDFDKYIRFINQVAGIKFEEYNGTGWMSSAGANFETLGTGVNTFLNSIEKVEVTDGFNNVIAIMEKLRDNFGDKTATNVYDNLTQIGQGAGNFATSVLAAFSTDIGKIDDDSPEEKMEKLLTLTEFFNSFAWVMEAGQNLKKSGKNLILGLLEGILEKVPLIGMSGEEVAKAFIDAFHEASDENSPSVEMFTAGVYLILGLVNGIDESLSLVKESGKSVFENFKEAFFNAAKEKGIVPTDLTKNLMGNQIISMLKNKDYKGVANKLKEWRHLQDPIKDRNPKTAKKEEQEEKQAEKKEKQEVIKTINVKKELSPEEKKVADDIDKKLSKTNETVEETTKETTEALQSIDDKTTDTSEKTPEVEAIEDVQAQLKEQEKQLEELNNADLDLLNNEDFNKAMEAYATEANMDAYESWFQQALNGSNAVGDQIMDAVGGMFDGWKDPDSIIGSTMDSINGFIFGDDDKKGLIGQLKDELAEGIVHPLEDLLNAGLSESTINKLLESDLFNSFFENSFLSDITNIDTFKNLLYSSTNIEDLLNNLKEQFPSLDLSSIGLEDLSNELLAFSNDAHYMGGADIENNLVDQIDELLGMLDSEGNYIGDINGSLSGVRSELSSISDALGSNGTVTSAIEGAGDATDTTKAIQNAIEEAKVDPKITEMAFRVIRGEFGNNPDRQRLLEEAGYSYAVIQNEVNRLLGNGFRYQTTQEDVNRTLQALGGATQNLSESADDIVEVGKPVLNTTSDLKEKIDEQNAQIEELFKYATQSAAAKLATNGYADAGTLVHLMETVKDKEDFRNRVEEAVKKAGNYEQYQKAMESANNNIYRAVSKSQVGDVASWFTKDVMAELLRGYGLNEDFINKNLLNIDPHAVQIIKNIEQIPTAQEKLNDLMDELSSANGTLAAKDYESALTELKDVYNDAKKIAKENGYVFASSKVRKAMDDAKELSELAKLGLDQLEEEKAGNNTEELNKEIRETRKNLKKTLNTTLTDLMVEWPELTDNINHIRELTDSGDLKGALEDLKDFSKKLNGKAVALNDREKHTFENEFLRAQSRIDSGSPERAEDSLKKIYNGTKHMIYSLDDQADGVLNKTKETENTLKTIQSLTERSDSGLSDSKDAMKKMWEMSQLDEHYKLDKKSNGWWQTESEKVEDNYKYTKHALELLQDEYEKSGAKMETQAIRDGKAYLDEFKNMILGADRLRSTTFQNAEEEERITKNRVAKMRDLLKKFVEDCGEDYVDVVPMINDAIDHLDDDNLENMTTYFEAISSYISKDVEEKTNEYSNLGDKLAYIEEKLASGDADFALVAIQELNGQIQELSDELFNNIEATKEHVKTVVAEVYDSVSGDLISKIYDDGTEVFEKYDQEVEKRFGAPKYSDALVEILDPESGDLLSTVLADGTEIFEAGKEAGKNYATGIDEGFTQQAPSSGEHIAKLVHGSVIDKANAVLGINSPSKEFFAMGEYCMMGFLLGFSQYLGDVETASGQLSEAAMSGFNQMQDYFTKLGDWMNGDEEITPQISPVLELDNQTADLGQLMTGQALLTINGVQIAGLDNLYDLINKSIESDRENAQAIVDAIGATRQDFLTLKDAIQGMKVTIDKKKLVGEIFSDIDTKMGKSKALKARSV